MDWAVSRGRGAGRRRPRGFPVGRGASPHAAVLYGMSLLGLCAVGCSERDPPTLVAQPACGLSDDLIDSLRVKARGDFPEGSGTEVVFSGGDQTLAWGDRPVEGVTVEGLFGRAVEAVGRTARLHDEGEIPVYFARVDGLCPVEEEAGPREAVAAAVGPMGDVVVVGGRDEQGEPLNHVLHFHDEEGRMTLLPGGLPRAAVGQTVHWIGARRFLAVGGATVDGVVSSDAVVIDLDDDRAPVGSPVPVRLDPDQGPARAFHAGAVDPSGRILIVGGCQRVTDALECALGEPGDPHEDPAVLETSAWIERDGGSLDYRGGPAVVVPRYGATLMFSRDGVAYLAGGRDELGMPVHVVERHRPGTSGFRRYGGDLAEALEDDVPVVGATLQEGGVVVMALADGRIYWVNEHDRDEFRPWSSWCEGEGAPCFADSSERRGMITLPGERVLVDGMLLPVGGISLDGRNARDLFVPGAGTPVPPARRVGSFPVPLADGTVLLIGGRDPESNTLASPATLRMRPALDGPDERIPELDRAAPGSLIARDPDRAVIEGETLRLLAAEEAGIDFPRVRVHARGFRSAGFRFEVTVQVPSGEVVPHLVLEHGGVEAVSVALQPDGVVGHVRDPQGRVIDISCSPQGLDFDEAQVLRVDVSAESISIRRGGESVAQCPGLSGERPWSVGVGASGSGEMLVTNLRLARQ